MQNKISIFEVTNLYELASPFLQQELIFHRFLNS